MDELYGKLSRMEFVTLVEGLVLISNELQNFEVQASFIENLAKPVCNQLRNLENHFASPQAFCHFIGKPVILKENFVGLFIFESIFRLEWCEGLL